MAIFIFDEDVFVEGVGKVNADDKIDRKSFEEALKEELRKSETAEQKEGDDNVWYFNGPESLKGKNVRHKEEV